MTKVLVNVFVCYDEKLTVMFRRIQLDMEGKELSNKQLNKAFEEQHPDLLAKIPTWTDRRGFTFRAGFECQVLYTRTGQLQSWVWSNLTKLYKVVC